jgi:UDP-4-amino-4,6-dideoxy-N-acetyl-beta-L-altrosamine transaminase
MIPYGRQEISQADVDAVVAVLQSDFLTQGPRVPAFEEAVARYCGAVHGVASNSATSALHLACMALDLGPGDRLWTSPITFVASANCARYCGANVDFVDIDPLTYNISIARLTEKLRHAQREDKLPKVVVPVHLTGQPCDMAAIHMLSQEYGFRIVEDASHAIGARYRDEPVGNCRHSDVTVFSFHPVKIVTTAEGGMATTNNPDLADRMARLRNHGITREPSQMNRKPDGPWYYEQKELGYNYRMTDIQAALGLSQMSRLGDYVSRRHEIAAQYNERLAGLPLTLPWQDPDCYSAYHLYVVRLQAHKARHPHHVVFERLRQAGIGVNLHYIPVYRQPYYAAMGFSSGDFKESEGYYREAISLPLYPTLNEPQVDTVVDALHAALAP